MRELVNVHERWVRAPRERLASALDALGGPEDELWPSPAWFPMVLDRPLAVGARGGHATIRYAVIEHDPGRRVRFAFRPGRGLDGWHEFTLTDAQDGCVLRHELRVRPSARMRQLVDCVIAPLHDALLEDLLDRAELLATGRLRRRARWSPWVRMLWPVVVAERPRRAAVHGRLLESAGLRHDLADAWQVRLRPGMPSDPQAWADAVFRDPPRWMRVALGLRQAIVPLGGIPRAGPSAFDTLERDGDELMLGSDDAHLDFRALVRVDEAVTVTTIAQAHNRRGRAYLALVRLVHPLAVRSMLARAFRTHAPRGGGKRARRS